MSETITVVGNITQPDFKVTQSGVPILNFRIASTDRRFDKVEEKWVDGATNWYSVSVFRRLAEHASRSLRKGDRVMVTGRLRLRDWETALKKGVTAEIDADALGHDLLWGMTTFHRSGGSTHVEPSGESVAGESPSTVAAWAAPGTEPRGDSVVEWEVRLPADADTAAPDEGEADAARRDLVGVGADTPF